MTAAAFDIDELAFQNGDVLAAIDEAPLGQIATVAELARMLGRDKSNLSKTLARLMAEGFLENPPLSGLTRAGEDQLAAWRRARNPDAAEGGAPSVWPLDRIVRNPANRKIDPATIPGMADSLAAQGQLQPITLTPVRDDGTRMLLIGERRWLGAVMAAEQGRLPDSLADGLRFEEREATPAQALAITLIENSERQDIPPLEEAFLLRDLADALGFNAVETADHLGRKPRDVQDKIRIARNASPEALAAYAQDGSWDRLRDSIPTSRKPGSLAGAIEELDQADREGEPLQWTTHDVHRSPFSAIEGGSEDMLTIWVMWDGASRYTIDWILNLEGGEQVKHTGGEVLPNAALALERAIGAIRERFRGRLPRGAIRWLDELQGPFVVDGVDCFNASNAGERRKAIGWEPRLSNSGTGRVGSGGPEGPTTAAHENALPLPEGDQPGLRPRARLALVEIAHKTAEQPRPISPTDSPEWTGDPDRDFAAFGAAAGKFWLDPAFNELQQLRMVRAVMQTDQPPIIVLTTEGVAWFRANAVDLPVSEYQLGDAQIASLGLGGSLTLSDAKPYATDWLSIEATPAPSVIDAHQDAEAALTADLYDRTPDQIAADADLLARVRAFADQDQTTPDGVDFPSLWTELGLAAEVVITESGHGVQVQPTDGSPSIEILTADAGGGLPDERADAVAWLTAWAIEQALGGPQGDRTAGEGAAA